MSTQRDALIQKDKILEEALHSLADSDLVNTMILQGGGALHFVYSSPRYSGDVDFVDESLFGGSREYADRLKEAGRDYEICKVKMMSSGLGVRAKWGHEEGKFLAKVEVEARDAGEYSPSEGKYPFLVKTPQDIYADKIFANIARHDARKNSGQFPFKPTDFFDLKYLTETLNCEAPSKEVILRKARAYNEEQLVNSATLTEMIDLINDESNHDFFRACLKKSMIPDVYSLHDFDKAYFQKAAEHFEQYRTE